MTPASPLPADPSGRSRGRRARPERGQATVELVGIALVLALLGVSTLAAVRAGVDGLGVRAAVAAESATPSFVEPASGALPPGLSTAGGAPLAVAEALLARGIHEQPSGSNRGPAVDVFTDGNAEPWCADFVSWVLRAGGRPFSGGASGGWRVPYTGDVRAWFAARGLYRARAVADPQPGDVIYFRRGRGHVGIVRRVEGDVLETIEGNASDSVRINRYAGWRFYDAIDGFGRP